MIPMTLRAPAPVEPAPDRVAVLCILGSCLFLQLGAALATQLFPHAGTWATSSLRVLIAGVILLAVSRPAMWRWTPEQWGCALVLVAVGTSVMASLIPATLELIAMRRLRPQVFSILISFEPAFAALIGWIVLHQDPSALKLAAIALVISASVNQTLAGRRLRKTMPPAV